MKNLRVAGNAFILNLRVNPNRGVSYMLSISFLSKIVKYTAASLLLSIFLMTMWPTFSWAMEELEQAPTGTKRKPLVTENKKEPPHKKPCPMITDLMKLNYDAMTSFNRSGQFLDIFVLRTIEYFLRTKPTMTELILQNTTIQEEMILPIAEALSFNNCHLTSLDLTGNFELGELGVQLLCDNLHKNSSLTSLNLKNCMRNGNSLPRKAICECLKTNTTLQFLGLGNNHLAQTYNGAKVHIFVWDLSRIPTLSLTSLDMSGNWLGDDLASLNSVLMYNRKFPIKILDLSENGITDQGARKLAEALQTNDSLTELYLKAGWLNRNNITDNGGICFAEALRKNSTLKVLDLTGNPIGEKGRNALGEICKEKEEKNQKIRIDL